MYFHQSPFLLELFPRSMYSGVLTINLTLDMLKSLEHIFHPKGTNHSYSSMFRGLSSPNIFEEIGETQEANLFRRLSSNNLVEKVEDLDEISLFAVLSLVAVEILVVERVSYIRTTTKAPARRKCTVPVCSHRSGINCFSIS